MKKGERSRSASRPDLSSDRAYARGLEAALVALAGPRKAEAFFEAVFACEPLRPARRRAAKVPLPTAYASIIDAVRESFELASIRRSEARIGAWYLKHPRARS
jgi:hypothetical protein